MLPYVDLVFDYPATLTGASVDERMSTTTTTTTKNATDPKLTRTVKLISSFLLSYPLAAILKRIPDAQPWKKNVFIIAVSLFYVIGLFDLWTGLRTLFISSAAIYGIAYYIDGSLMPWIGFFFLMAHMSVSQIYRQLVDDAQLIDITGAQMVLVMKLSSFCWNVHDGRLPKEGLSEAQRYAAITEFPSLLDYTAYVLFFPSLFAGPSFDFVDYKRWISTTLFDIPPDTDPSKAPPTRKKRRIPRSGRPATKKAVLGVFWILLFLVLGSSYNQDTVLGHNAKYLNISLPRRVLTLYLIGFTTRLKYYGVWSLTEGACILSGMGYNGFDQRSGKVFWDRLENVDPWSLETAQNSHAYLGSWNKNTNHWLKNYIYLRVTPKGKKPGFRASMATFVTSALWHGFYPGYYLTFVLGSFIQTAAKNFRRHIRPFFLTATGAPTSTKPYYDLLTWLTTQVTLTFAILPFIYLTFPASLAVWGSVYYYGIVGTLSSLIIFGIPGVKASLAKKLAAVQGQTTTSRGSAAAAAAKAKGEESDRDHDQTLGLPADPGRELDEAVKELRGDLEGTVRMRMEKS